MKLYFNRFLIVHLILLYLFFIVTVASFATHASMTNSIDANIYYDLFTPLKPTPELMVSEMVSMPRFFNSNNNLRTASGSFNSAIGEPLYIVGRVLDVFGVPIGNAKIEIWHTNASGKYHTLVSRNSKYVDPNFSISGTAISDNMGYYSFVTIFPGFYDKRAPHINVSIKHKHFGNINTQIYFDDHPRNKKDIYLMAYKNSDRALLLSKISYVNDTRPELGKVAEFNIVINGIHKYKSF